MPLRNPDERIRDILRTTFDGSLGGDALNAQPITPINDPFGDDSNSSDSSSDTGNEDIWWLDRWVLVASGAQSFTLTYVAVEESLFVFLNGLALDEGDDYTVAWETGVVSVTFPVETGDIVMARYVTRGDVTNAVQGTTGELVVDNGWLWEADTLGLSDGAAVATWPDKTNTHSFAQATGANQPVFAAAGGPGGVPAVRCTSGSKWMLTDTISGPLRYWLIVCKYNVLNTGQTAMLGADSVANQARRILYWDSSGTVLGDGYFTQNRKRVQNGVNAPTGNWTPPVAQTAWNIWEAMGFGATAITNSFTNRAIAFNATGGFGPGGDVSIVAVYAQVNEPTTDERDQILEYFSAKYGISVIPAT